MLQVILAMLVMPRLGWRWLLALSALPSLSFVLASSWLPESARYTAASGHRSDNQQIYFWARLNIFSPCSEQALDTLGRVARQNGKSMLLGRLVVDDTYGITRGRLADLLAKVSSHWLRRVT